MPDDDDRPRDAHSAADPAWSLAAAPDDISGLAADIASYHRELRAARRHAWLKRIFARPSVTALAMTAAGLVLAGIVATVLSVIDPHSANKGPSPLPVAAHPAAAPGQVNGLLPNVDLQAVGGNSVSSLAIRPAVIAVIPLHCQCASQLNTYAASASSKGLPLIVVAPTVADAEATALSGQLTSGRPQIFYDTAGALARDFGATDLTLVLLDRDGTIFQLERGATDPATAHLDTLLQQMLAPRAQASG